MLKKQNGLTLIALIITIIVMIILAGVSLSLTTGDDGVLNKAKLAKEETRAGQVKEILDLWVEDTKIVREIGTNDEETIEEVINRLKEDKLLTEEEIAKINDPYNINKEVKIGNQTISFKYDKNKSFTVGTVVTGNNRTLTGGPATTRNPIIPVGFKAVNDGASWAISGEEIIGWNDGLVIEDENLNQFVWVPVDGINVKYEKWCSNSNGYGEKHENVTDDLSGAGIQENTQITKYGGFWIGRYEAGINDIDSNTSLTNDVTNGVNLLIKKGAQPWNFISYTNAKTVAENYKNNENVKSGLITGTQWDTTMKWIENAGYNVTVNSTEWGNYSDNTQVTGNGRYTTSNGAVELLWQTGTFSKAENNVTLIGTGIFENANAKNIYDLAGNLYEWNAEKSSSYSIFRGGCCNSAGTQATASSRTNPYMNGAFGYVGFRVVLYVM